MTAIFKKYQKFLIFLFFFVLAFGFFSFTLNDFFVSDDFDWLTVAKNTKNVFSYFWTNYLGERSGGTYSPFLNLIFYVEWHIWNLNPFGYHLINLLFHVGSTFFVFLIGVELNSGQEDKKKWAAILASFFFLIFPVHAEAVNWIAARPHVIGTFFYLVAFWSYLKFRRSGKVKFILAALTAFIFSLLTKELALTLPFVILLIEIFAVVFAVRPCKLTWFGRFFYLGTFFVFSVIYILIRYFATGILFGYYGQSSFVLKTAQIFKTFVSGVLGLISWSSARIFLTKMFLDDYKVLLLVSIFLAVLLFLLRRHIFGRPSQSVTYKILTWEFFVSSILFVIPFCLILFLQFSPTSDEGERYLYLPSVGFCFLLSFLLLNIFKKKTWLIIFSLVIIFYFSLFLVNKNLIWYEASKISKKIVDDFGKVIDIKNQDAGLVLFSLPDNYEGAQVFRNGIKLAISLYYPNYHPEPVIFVPFYLRLDKFNKNDKIINWEIGKNCDYVFGMSKNGRNEITGFDRQETENFIFELWGYDYSTFTSNAVKLKLKEPIKELMRNKKIHFLMYNEGELQKFEWCFEKIKDLRIKG